MPTIRDRQPDRGRAPPSGVFHASRSRRFVRRARGAKGYSALRGAVELIARAGGGVVEGYPHYLQEGEKMRPQFLYNTTRSLYEQTGFSYDRPKGKKNCVMRTTVAPIKASRRARVG